MISCVLFTIARYIIVEQLHHRLPALFCGMLAVPLIGAHVLGQVALASYEKLLIDAALHSFSVFIFFYLALCAVPFFYRQAHYQTYQFFMPLLPRRAFFFYGAMLGFAAIIILGAMLWYLIGTAIIWYLTSPVPTNLWIAYAMTSVEGCFLLCASVSFALAWGYQIGIIMLPVLYVVGYNNAVWYALLRQQFPRAATLLHHLLPNLYSIDIKSCCVHQLPIDYGHVLLATLNVFLWCALFLYIGKRQFDKKVF